MNEFTLSITVYNKYGVLSRVVGLFSKRGYNINSLHVDAPDEKSVVRIIVSSKGDDATKLQLVKQINKLHDVKEIKII